MPNNILTDKLLGSLSFIYSLLGSLPLTTWDCCLSEVPTDALESTEDSLQLSTAILGSAAEVSIDTQN